MTDPTTTSLTTPPTIPMPTPTTSALDPITASAAALDAADPLAPFRARFALPDGVIYLDGNSLGPLPHAAVARLQTVVTQEWGSGLIRSWNDADWIGAPARVGAKIARLVGAAPHEVLVADSTSVNLHKVIVAALLAQPERMTILSEPGNFPTDLYLIESAIRTLGRGHRLVLAPREEIAARCDADTALVLLTHVHYRTAEVYDLAAVTRAAHAAGARICWDLSHSLGAMPIDLTAAGADYAVGCGYKFLNGGPGAPAMVFVAERHHATLETPLGGWLGHARPFAFEDAYAPAPGIARLQCGTPPVLSLAALEVGVELMLEADLTRVAEKSRALCERFRALVEARCAAYGAQVVGPPPGAPRGSHVSVAHPEAYAVMQALIARGVIGDYRVAPDGPGLMRFGITPLYLRFADVDRAVAVLEGVLREETWRAPEFQRRRAVT